MRELRRRSNDDARWAAVMMAPAAVALATLALYPILASIEQSLHRFIVVFRERRFIGVSNYVFLFRDGRFWSALGHTVYFTFVSVALELALGLGFALLMHARMPGRTVLRAAILVPWAIPTVVSARMWSWFFRRDDVGFTTLLLGSDVDWLGTPGYAMHAAILVDVWKTTPFVALLLLAGLAGVPSALYDSAAVDGASRVRTLVSVTLPILRPVLAVTALLRALDAFRVFDVVYVLTEGGPANTTETLSIYAYKTMMRGGDFGYGSALSVVTFACVLGLGLVYVVWARQEEKPR
jgi:multiple sugar transport system permease protein